VNYSINLQQILSKSRGPTISKTFGGVKEQRTAGVAFIDSRKDFSSKEDV
jgi:hypothetical protein